MSAVVGIDLSTKAIDIVKLNQDDNIAEWVRCELRGPKAWERTLGVRDAIRDPYWQGERTGMWSRPDFFDDVYCVAVEAPYGHGSDVLNRVVGAVVASLPRPLRHADLCWIVRPDEWKKELEFSHSKPTWEMIARAAPGAHIHGFTPDKEDEWQHARDAYCIALFARNTLERAFAERTATPDVAQSSLPL